MICFYLDIVYIKENCIKIGLNVKYFNIFKIYLKKDNILFFKRYKNVYEGWIWL